LVLGGLDLRIRGVVEFVQHLVRQRRQALIEFGTHVRASLEQTLLAYPVLQPLAPPTERLEDGFRRRGEPTLESDEGEPDRALAAVVFELGGPVELLANVVGDLAVEGGFGVREFVVGGVGSPLWKEGRGVELEEVLLREPAHEV
jgi:hypothetical protein